MATEDEIRRAKEYLVLRLRAERTAVSTMEAVLLTAARRIADIAQRYNIPPEKFRFSANKNLQREVNEVLALLKDVLESHVRDLDTFEEEGKEAFAAPALTEKDAGKTFRERPLPLHLLESFR